MALVVPPPTLKQDSTTGPAFGFNKPIELTCSGITFPDGRPLVFDNALASGFLLYRATEQGVVTAWHEEEPRGAWVAAVPGPEPQPLLYHEDVWKSILVALGEKDAQDRGKFEPPSGSTMPSYYVRCFFAGKDVHGERHEGASPPSNLIKLDAAAASEDELAGIEFVPPDLNKVERVRIFLKHKPLGETAELKLERNATGLTARLSVESPARTNSVTIDANWIRVVGPLDVNGWIFP